MRVAAAPTAAASSAFVLALVLAASVGCKKKSEEPKGPPPPPPVTTEESTRGDDACRAYLEKLCACSAARPDDTALAERCQLDRALPGAMKLSLEASLAPETTAVNVRSAQLQFRTMVKRCIEGTAKLPTLGCPQ